MKLPISVASWTARTTLLSGCHPASLLSLLLHLSLEYGSKKQPFQTPRLSMHKVATIHHLRLQLVPNAQIFQQVLLFEMENDQWINTSWLWCAHMSFKFSPRCNERGNTIRGNSFLPCGCYVTAMALLYHYTLHTSPDVHQVCLHPEAKKGM